MFVTVAPLSPNLPGLRAAAFTTDAGNANSLCTFGGAASEADSARPSQASARHSEALWDGTRHTAVAMVFGYAAIRTHFETGGESMRITSVKARRRGFDELHFGRLEHRNRGYKERKSNHRHTIDRGGSCDATIVTADCWNPGFSRSWLAFPPEGGTPADD